MGMVAATNAAAQDRIPKPQFQGDFFGEMARAFCTIQKVDVKARVLEVKLDRESKIVRVPVRDDTELHFRDSWGELDDYFPGQHVMLFMYVDEDRAWTYPRAIQDDVHVSARHGWFARVTKIDAFAHSYTTRREEKNGQGEVTKVIENTYPFAPDAKVWKSDQPAGISALQIGDEVIQQQVEQGGKLVAVELFDRKGDDAIRTAQDARHRQDQERLGLPAYVNDLEVVSGSLVVSVAWSGSDRAKELKPGAVVSVVPTGGGKLFAAAVSSTEQVDTRQRLQLVVNARVASRLAYGDPLRVFLPGTGPEVPSGKSGIPVFKP
jgi:hypothetical protein